MTNATLELESCCCPLSLAGPTSLLYSKKSVYRNLVPFPPHSLSLSLSLSRSMNGRGGVKLANIIEQQEGIVRNDFCESEQR